MQLSKAIKNNIASKLMPVVMVLLLCGMNVRAVELKGTVSCNGKGIANVEVTDGNACTLTDSKGCYRLISEHARFIYISTPAGYLAPREKSLPVFYKQIESGVETYDFTLEKNAKDDTHHLFLAQADVQLIDTACLRQYNTMIPDCVDLINQNRELDVFGVDCGDIVGDTHGLYPGYLKATDRMDVPVFRAIGNHDMDYFGRSHETSTHTFEDWFGPTRFSFNKGKAHYIVIDNNFFIGRDYFYMGYVDEKTFHWLEQDLSYVPKGSMVFLIMHIPTRLNEQKQQFAYTYSNVADQTVNYPALYDMLKPFKTHIIDGHMHYNLTMVQSPTMIEHNTGAVCGTWWLTDICLDGTPRGYGVYEVNGDSVSWYYKSAGYPRNYQMRVYPAGSVAAYPNDIVANVWNWDSAWKVEWSENGVIQGAMNRFTGSDPEAAAFCSDKKRVKYDWISVFSTDHLFRATPHDNNARIEVKVTDRFGNVYWQKLNH